MKRNNVIVLLLIIVLTVSAFGTIINIPDDYATIQEGIDSSSHGDTVLVQPGTYIENINFNGHNIVLGSMFLMTGDTSYISQTIIDGDRNGSVIIFENSEDSTAIIIGFTIQNGFDSGGGGIFCELASPCIRNNLITGNEALSRGGGGILCNESNATINNNVITNNTADWDGGGIICNDADLTISGNFFAYNISTY